MTVPVRWRKSSRSGQETNCVEVAHTRGALRDSKAPNGPQLQVPLADLLQTVKAGRLIR